MSKVDYYGIQEELSVILRESLPDGYVVTVEEEIMFSSEQTPWVGIYIDRRDAMDGMQSLSSGRRTQYRLAMTLWVWCFSLDRGEALRLRDDAVSEVEVALMKNRTINDKSGPMLLRGGRLPSARVKSDAGIAGAVGFIAGGEILVSADVSATI